MSLYLVERHQEDINNVSKEFSRRLYLPEGEQVLKYLTEERGLSLEIIDKFQLGFCPTESQLSLEGNPLYPQLKYLTDYCVVFPVIDEFGDTVAFSGRIPRQRKKGEAPWKHDSYEKKFFPYGMNVAWPHILEKGFVILVEGQVDVISMHSYGFTNTVGVLGSGLYREMLIKLLRFTNEFVFMYDSDIAGNKGRKATHRPFEIALDCDIDFKYVPMSFDDFGKKHFDPDELLKEIGADKVRLLIERTREGKIEAEFDKAKIKKRSLSKMWGRYI